MVALCTGEHLSSCHITTPIRSFLIRSVTRYLFSFYVITPLIWALIVPFDFLPSVPLKGQN